MPRVWNPDYKLNLPPSDIWDQEFTVWEWNFPDNEEVVEADDERQEVLERPIRRE